MTLVLNWVLDDINRIERSKTVKLTDIVIGNTIEECRALCKGSKGNEYHVTLIDCECRDFFTHRKPCKHMIRLAMQAGCINENGLTPDATMAKETMDLAHKVALAAGYYHVFRNPIIPDSIYNRLKWELWDNSPLVDDMYGEDGSPYWCDSTPCADFEEIKPLLKMTFAEFVAEYAAPIAQSGKTNPHVSLSAKSKTDVVSIRIYLDSNGYEYIDKTSQGGGLYFFDPKAADVIRAMGVPISYMEKGNRATKHRPAWFLRQKKL